MVPAQTRGTRATEGDAIKMGWLEFCQRTWPTYAWQQQGCKLSQIPRDEYNFAYKVAHDEAEKNNTFINLTAWDGVANGMNPHKEGRLHVDRGRLIIDIPFWATKWLVFGRDTKCQGCGTEGYEGRTVWGPRASKIVYDKPLTEELPEWRKPTPKDSMGLEVHHVIPVVKGGANCTHNCILLCFKCHESLDGKGGIPTKMDGKQLTLA